MPLGALKRVPSAHRRPFRPEYNHGKSSEYQDDRASGAGAGKVRSVEEKKALVSRPLPPAVGGSKAIADESQLGSWLGNVDALVRDVERVGFMGARPAHGGQ